jgi:DNA-binding PadR family transcriptional regulator
MYARQEERLKKNKNSGSGTLTLPDLVLLSLLAERPMHGYEANAELERRQVRDWAGISRAQVYYSLEKLKTAGLLRASREAQAAAGPEKHTFATTPTGKAALAKALAREDWALVRERPPFLTWLALSWQADARTVRGQFGRREAFLRSELEREEATHAAVLSEVGHAHHEAVWMLRLTLEHLRAELSWLRSVTSELHRRAPAKNK